MTSPNGVKELSDAGCSCRRRFISYLHKLAAAGLLKPGTVALPPGQSASRQILLRSRGPKAGALATARVPGVCRLHQPVQTVKCAVSFPLLRHLGGVACGNTTILGCRTSLTTPIQGNRVVGGIQARIGILDTAAVEVGQE